MPVILLIYTAQLWALFVIDCEVTLQERDEYARSVMPELNKLSLSNFRVPLWE